MRPEQDAQSWFGPSLLEPGVEQADKPEEFERVWRGFMTARATLGLVLLLLQSTIYVLGNTQDTTLILICAAYFSAALGVRLLAKPRALSKALDLQWLGTIGVDILVFAALQFTQGSSINYAPLFALPVLVASILGSLLMALGAAASVTLWLFAYAAWLSLQNPGDTTAYFLQAALTGTGCFSISFLAHQIASRLANVEQRAQRSQLAARVQLSVGQELLTQGLVKAKWSADTNLTAQINPEVAHYTGQTELAAVIQEGLAAKSAGNEELATTKLGRAVQLAAETGNDEATAKLRKVVDVQDAEAGTVRLKKAVEKADEMALDTASTKTTRVRK